MNWALVEDGRTIRFGRGSAGYDAVELLGQGGFGEYCLLTTERAAASAPLLAQHAAHVVYAGHGLVADVATDALARVGSGPLVALGGGRVIDSAKAIAALQPRPEGVAAIPTTLSGAELTPIHRRLPGTTGPSLRPSLVICDPALMASQPMPALAASAMNALAHACEARWNANGTPITDAVAERAVGLIVGSLERMDRDELALGAVFAAHAFGLIGVGVHHLVCQTLVQRVGGGLPHALVNAVVLPHSCALMARRAPDRVEALDRPAIGVAAARAGATRLRELGHGLDELLATVPVMLERPELARTPGVTGEDLVRLVEEAW
jgi:alcohol dehydrogenase class IV